MQMKYKLFRRLETGLSPDHASMSLPLGIVSRYDSMNLPFRWVDMTQRIYRSVGYDSKNLPFGRVDMAQRIYRMEE